MLLKITGCCCPAMDTESAEVLVGDDMVGDDVDDENNKSVNINNIITV